MNLPLIRWRHGAYFNPVQPPVTGLRGENVVWFINPEHHRGGMRLLFVCVGNTCRSQMAEAIARDMGHEAVSAGTHAPTGGRVAKKAIEVLMEIGIDASEQYPKSVESVDTGGFDKIISMGCGVHCPTLSIDDDWGLEDPYGKDIEFYKQTLEEIKHRIGTLD